MGESLFCRLGLGVGVGVGFPPELEESVFNESLERGKETLTSLARGKGLGGTRTEDALEVSSLLSSSAS